MKNSTSYREYEIEPISSNELALNCLFIHTISTGNTIGMNNFVHTFSIEYLFFFVNNRLAQRSSSYVFSARSLLFFFLFSRSFCIFPRNLSYGGKNILTLISKGYFSLWLHLFMTVQVYKLRTFFLSVDRKISLFSWKKKQQKAKTYLVDYRVLIFFFKNEKILYG
ncbi:MAG: hypothetical protein LBI60_02685 [Bacteroidales bacterium]|jgi:hypothetical protein|nr:hypothetical protein [Bacteroidales bacterium]